MASVLGELLKSINKTKENLLQKNELYVREYQPFVINRTLSYFKDTIFFVNEINQFQDLDNKMQYDFLLNSIRARSRFKKWDKKKQYENVSVIMEYYNYSTKEAERVHELFDKNKIEQMKKELYKGGTK